MRRGICVKCGQAGVRYGRATLYFGTHPSGNTGHASVPNRQLPTSAESVADTYMCIYCGYFEQHLPDPHFLAFVNAYWAPVPPQ